MIIKLKKRLELKHTITNILRSELKFRESFETVMHRNGLANWDKSFVKVRIDLCVIDAINASDIKFF